MKLSKNILILFVSYIGMLVLVCCTAQLLAPLGAEGEVTVAGGAESGDVPAGLVPQETDGESASAPEMSETEETVGAELPESDASETDASETEAVGYTVRTVTGEGNLPVIAICDGEGTVLRYLDLSVSLLPRTDRAALAEGIAVPNDAALAALIEDLGG